MDLNTITSAATQYALPCGVDVVKRHAGYFCNYSDKFKEVKHNVELLEDAKKRVENDVKEAEMNAEEIHDDVQHWLKQVDEKIKEYTSFLGDERHTKTMCSIGFFPYSLQLRYRLGRKAAKLAEDSKADKLWDRKFEDVSYQPGLSMDAAFSNIGYESFVSRKKTMDMIMRALEDSTVSMIGLYGVGGVGKTTIVKEVAKIVQEKKLFNMVTMANITRNPDIRKVQGQIAEMLGLRLEEESEIIRADRLRKRLKKGKESILVILDDIWDGLDLDKLGIPCSEDNDDSQRDVKDITDLSHSKMEKEKLSADYNKVKVEKFSGDYNKIKAEKLSGNHKECKILLTSRSKEVLCSQMDVKERSAFSVGILDEKEAETLFKKVAGIHGKDPVLDGKANEIAKTCAGLPIVLVSIGRALKNKSSFVWEDVYGQIKRQTFTEGQESIEFSIKLSYDHLKNEQLKYIFLQCARMGNDPLIIDLVKFCIGLGLLQGVHTIREARSRVNVLIGELKESSLLMESYSHDRFQMHDIVRDVALSISSKEKHTFFMKNGILDEWPHKDKLESYTAIVLHCCDINDDLPESIHCPKLEVFHIDSKDDCLKIPDNIFEGMVELRVLILIGVNLSSLPSSIKCLKKLRMLCLERCTLGMNLSIIGELKKLRILTLTGSYIESLPVQLGELDKVQLFDLSNCLKLRVVPSNIISRMYSLEELYMRDILIPWEDNQRIQGENASLLELRHLNQLRSLEIHIPRDAYFPQNLFFDKLDSYKIEVGEFDKLPMDEFKMPDKYEAVKFLALDLRESIDFHSRKWVKMLFKRVQNLLIGELNNVHDVFYELNVEGFPDLKHLNIVNNFSIQSIINSTEQLHPLQAFPKLESMYLYNMENLEKVCGNQLTGASFCKLKIVKIETCGKLKNLFTVTLLRLLIMLETIEVRDCDSLKQMVFADRQAYYTISDVKDEKIEFPQLRILTLQSLPVFTCLYMNTKMPSISQDQVLIENKENTTNVWQGLSLFNEKVSIPKLEWLELSSIHIQKIWSDQSLHCFQNLLTLNVTDCGNLTYLLSFSMAANLVNLQSLFVSGCEMMENIFRIDDAMTIDIFPKLKEMEIISMKKLNTIWQPHFGLLSFHSLDSLTVRECGKLATIFPSYMGDRFQSIQTLVVTDCQSVENIFNFGNIPHTNNRDETNLHYVYLQMLPNLVHVWKEDRTRILKYNNLQSILVQDAPKLEYLFPLSISSGLEKLEVLAVNDCGGMKEIVACDKGSNELTITFRFPHLNTVSLSQLFELQSFYPGTHTLEWPSLKRLLIINCNKLEALTKETSIRQVTPIFSATEKVIYDLEHMAVSLKEAKGLNNYIVNVQIMHNIQSLLLFGLKNTEILLWFLCRLPNLENLHLDSCHFKKIWAPTSLVAQEKIGVVVQLKELIILNLLHLEEIGFEHDPILQRIERLHVFQCLKLTSLAPSSVSFCYLTYLEVFDCTRLKNLMTSSTAKSLALLTTMKVNLCQMVVEIVAKNEEDDGREIEFKQLKVLELVSLQSLTSFCTSEKCYFRFPLLENLVVSNCPQMEYFSQVQSAPNLRKVHVVDGENDIWYWEGDLNGTVQKIFTDQAYLKYSERMAVDYIYHPEMKDLQHGKPAFPDNFFRGLRTLMVDKSFNHGIVIPFHVLPNLKSLEELHVVSCNAVEIIFDIDDTETKKTKGTVYSLKNLFVVDLPNLKRVWNKTPQGIVSFPNLQHVIVANCGSLTTLLPSSIARNLVRLKLFDVVSCDMLVEIVEKEDRMELGSTETSVVFEFPCLSHLHLSQLPQLSCFYPGRHHLECPRLEELDVQYCSNLKLFASEFRSHPETLAEGQVNSNTPASHLQKPLFSVQKVVPKLNKLSLNEKNIILLSNLHLPLDQLWALMLYFEEENKKVTLPFDFLLKVPNLEFLKVMKCDGLKEIFPSQKLQIHDGILARLKIIQLMYLRKLKLIGLEHPWVKPLAEKLEELEVHECSSLKKLVRSAVSFINLKKLNVQFCKNMEYLLTFSTAKSLVQLDSLQIHECESLKEIVTEEDGVGTSDHEIMFRRLNMLRLTSLPSLVCFYSGNTTLQFSCLEEAVISQCPNMKTFSRGVISTPMFLGVHTEFDFHFHDDLNTTMERIYYSFEKPACDIQQWEFGGHPQLEEMWLGIVPIPSNKCFNNLTHLSVVECETLSYVVPFYLLPYLHNLKEIVVRNCQSVKAIFDVKDAKPDSLIFLPLKKLDLNQLPNLEYIWNMNPDKILSLQDLQEVHINNCQSLRSLFQTSVAINHLVKLGVTYCEQLEEIVAEDEVAYKQATKQLIFHCLTLLVLRELPMLKSLYRGKHSVEWPMLTHLDLYHCDMLKLFATEPHSSQDQLGDSINQQAIFSVEKVFPKLEVLSLKKEDVLMISQGQNKVISSWEHQTITEEDTRIARQNFGANGALLQNLKYFIFLCFHEDDESSIFSCGLLENIPNIVKLGVACSSFSEVFPPQRPGFDCTKILSKLKGLMLSYLYKLNSIGLDHSWVEPLTEVLESLEVDSCPCLKILVPSTVSFSNLLHLDVGECNGLVYLLTSSTAKSLGLLKEMTVWNCKSLQEIVSKEGDHESSDEEVIFGQLNTLSLQYLPSMVGFYTGTPMLKFPCLDYQVTLWECPQMKYSYDPNLHQFILLE